MDFLNLQAPKGTRDLSGQEAVHFTELESVARRVFGLFQFVEIRTPIFESLALFSRSMGETSDVVEKEMFTFVDRGERPFALRPEGTAGVVRHFIEEKLAVKGGPHRFFYMGPMFRAERPAAGRYRQFWQIGAEHFGPSEASVDADSVVMVAKILRDFGLTKFSVHVNSLGCRICRPRHREALLTYLKSKENILNEESKRRMLVNPLRVLDSKEDGPKLLDAPAITDYLCEDCRSHYRQFVTLLKENEIPLEENPRLVRGLDYYTRSVFEFVSPDLGAQNALAAGGRYDELVGHLGGISTPAVGFALGMDRVVTARKNLPTNSGKKHPVAVVVPLSEEAVPLCFSLSQQLRAVDVSVPPVTFGKKLKNQLASAVDFGANWAILIGEDELKVNQVTVKNLSTREQSQTSVDKAISLIRG
ncbi:MAG: Histidine--tRNA ligase [Elusimicrobia bacterium]|nr:Histidine--tRNA ligase [Elusimicrobiota bacterium]